MTVFDDRHMVVSRGDVYNKTTGRWLGPVESFSGVGETRKEKPTLDRVFADDASKVDLVAVARDVQLPGYSTLDKEELTVALLEIGAIEPGSAKEDDGESQPDPETDEPDTSG